MSSFIESIRGKVFLMVVPPVLVLTGIATVHAAEKIHALSRMAELQRLSEVTTTLAAVTRSLQAERSASILHAATPASSNLEAMTAARLAVDQNEARFRQALRERSAVLQDGTTPPALHLEELRSGVDGAGMDIGSILDGYGSRIASLRDMQAGLLGPAQGTPLESRTYAQSGIAGLLDAVDAERASVAALLASRTPSPGFRDAAAGFAVSQAVSLQNLRPSLPPPAVQQLERVLSGPGQDQFQRLRHSALNGTADADASTQWLAVSKPRWQELANLADQQSRDFLDAARESTRAASLDLAILLIGTLSLQILLIVFAWKLSRRITGPAEVLAAAMARLQEGDLTQQLYVQHTDEIGTMTVAFNEMSARLRSVHQQLKTAADEISGGSSKLATHAEQVSSAAQQLAKNAQRQRDQAGLMFEAVGALSIQIEKVRGQVESALDHTSELRELSNRGVQLLSGTGPDASPAIGLFEGIQGVAREVDFRTADVHAASEEQEKCSRQAAASAQQVNEGASAAFQAVSQLANTAPELALTARDLHQVSQRMAATSAFRI